MSRVKDQAGRVALVTGANRGLGFETCRQLGSRGFHVVLTSRDPQRGLDAARILRDEGLQISCHTLDVTDLEQVRLVRDAVIDEFARLDVLVNNAGVSIDPPDSTILDVPVETIERTLDVNCYGALRVIRAFVPLMVAQDYGRIVNVSSLGGVLSMMFTMRGAMAAYRLSKAALNAVTRLTAGAVKDHNIKVNAVCPGPIRTRMGSSRARRTPAQEAETIVWLATLPRSGPNGKLFRDRKRVDG
jgi:NAD(P)-dependent dehydrogenase (short-subunit alcohol dehydrogenase family)